jgi:hypothetical protein
MGVATPPCANQPESSAGSRAAPARMLRRRDPRGLACRLRAQLDRACRPHAVRSVRLVRLSVRLSCMRLIHEAHPVEPCV